MISTADAANALASGPLVHVVTLTAPGGRVLDVITGSLTLDETWTPYAQADLHLATADPDLLDLLDPRTGARATLTVGYQYVDGRTETESLTLTVVDAALSVPEQRLDVSLASDETRLLGTPWIGPGPAPIQQTSAAAAIQWCLNQLTGAPVLDARADSQTLVLPDLGVLPGTDLWDLASSIASASDLRLYHDGTTWILDSRVNYPPVAAALATGPAGTVISYRDARTLDGYADSVLVRAQWRDSTGTDRIETGVSATPQPFRWQVVAQSTPTTQVTADYTAATMRARLATRGRTMQITAKAAYWLRPRDLVTLDLSARPQERHRLRSIQHIWPAGRMTLTTSEEG